MICVVFLFSIQVFYRYVLGNALDWSQEILGYCFVAMIFLAISFAAQQKAHIRVELFINLMPGKVRIILFSIGDILWIIYNSIIIFESIKIIRSLLIYTCTSAVLSISLAYVYMMIPFGFLILSIRIIQNIYQRFK